jgi:eukaryotic-like serine/threonine-protein kinase
VDTETGRQLAARYVLTESLASGGMAEVWRGRDEVLGRDVAIKILHPHLAEDPSFLERFRREAVTAARLSHAAIVRVFDTGVDDGLCFIVMELSRGRSLAQILDDGGRLPVHDAVAVARGILEALEHAHRKDVVHRDVKPANVLMEGGQVKVTDFGIAKAAFGGDLTATGQLLGTARYLAPEQVAGGGEIDHRADLYSTGLVLYEMLVGSPPFTAETALAEASMRLTERPKPPGATRPGIPADLDEVVLRALAVDPEERFGDAGAMRAALDRVAMRLPEEPEPDAPPAAERVREGSTFRTWLLVPLLVLVIAATTVGVGLLVGGLEIGGPLGIRASQQEAQTEARPIEIVEAIPHDPPPGDGREHDADAPLAIDGDEATAWQTEGYETADLGGLKPGVGLILDLGEPLAVREVTIRSPTPGWAFELLRSDNASSFDDPLPSAEGDLSHRAEDATTIEVDGTRTRYLLVWITELVEVDGRYRALISDVEVRGG